MKSVAHLTLVREGMRTLKWRNHYHLQRNRVNPELMPVGCAQPASGLDLAVGWFENLFPGAKLSPGYSQRVRVTIEADWEDET